jgi:hypothetical protein
MPQSKVLFILKRKEDYNKERDTNIGVQTGLYNSAAYMNDMLNDSGVESKMVVVIDNNDIDREVTKFKPTHVIVEALWVVPSKFNVLNKLHPNVTWIVRLHSEIPFLSNEGMAMNWLGDYGSVKNVVISANAPRALEEVRFYLKTKFKWSYEIANEKVIYLPNFYPQDYVKKKLNKEKDTVDVGCFGAVRPLKNHLLQAIAAIKFAEKIGKKLRFHINSGRVEMKGEPILNNLQAMFMHLNEAGHQLIIHEWTPREGFLELCSQMDLGMQASFSETFNIVSADLISKGIPMIGSFEIPWICRFFAADAVGSDGLYKALVKSYNNPQVNVFLNQMSLKQYTTKSKNIWVNYFTK